MIQNIGAEGVNGDIESEQTKEIDHMGRGLKASSRKKKREQNYISLSTKVVVSNKLYYVVPHL